MNLLKWALNPASHSHITNVSDYYMMVDDIDTNITPVLLRDKNWEPKSTALLKTLLHPDDIFIDAGAHWGYYSLLAGKIGAKVYAFEPNPNSFLLLSVNVALNNLSNIMVLPLALWSRTALLNFVPEEQTTGGSHVIAEVITNPREYTRGIIVGGTSLDEIFEDEKIDFLKIDCEGTDQFVLHGAKHILETQKPKIMCEHPHHNLLEHYGYKQTHEFKDEQTTFWEKAT